MNKNFIFRIIFSLILIIFIVLRFDIREVISYAFSAKPFYIIIAFILIAGNYFFSSKRWQIILNAKGFGRTHKELLNLYFIGAFFNNFLPSSVGGDIVKAYKLGKRTKEGVDVAVSVFVERLIGLIALFIISTGAMISIYRWKGFLAFIGIWVSVAFGFWFLKFIKRYHPLLKKIHDSTYAYKNHKKALLTALLWGFVVQVISISSQYVVFLALGINPPFYYSFFILPLINFIAFLPITFNGLGVQDGMYLYFFSQVGPVTLDPNQVLAVSFTYHITRMLSSLIGGVLYAIER